MGKETPYVILTERRKSCAGVLSGAAEDTHEFNKDVRDYVDVIEIFKSRACT